MGQILTFPAPEVDRLDATADRLEHIQWCERETRIRAVNDRPVKITNADVWDKVLDGTIPALAAAAFVIDVIIGILERAMQ